MKPVPIRARISASARNLMLTRPARTASALAAARKGPLVIAGLFRTASGIGESARSCADALAASGHKPLCVDLSGAFNQTDLGPDRALSAMPDAADGTLILHVNAPETLPALRALSLYRRRNWRIAGCWVWELEAAPPEWRAATHALSEIWAPSAFCVEAFRRLTDIPVRFVPYRIAPPQSVTRRPPDGRIVALTMADGRSSLSRKNVEGAIRVFKAALGDRENCALIVKTRNLAEFRDGAAALRVAAAGHPRIAFIDDSLAPIDRWRLIASADILISLHRSEGFGLPVAEALSLGLAVVTTGWSAVIDFTPPEFLVPYALGPVNDPGGPYARFAESRWAEPDKEAAAALLARVAGGASRGGALIGNAGALSYDEALTA